MLLTFNFFLAILIFCFRCLKEFQFSPDVRCSWCQMSFVMLVGYLCFRWLVSGYVDACNLLWGLYVALFRLKVMFFASMPTFDESVCFDFLLRGLRFYWISFWCDAFRIFDGFPCLFIAIYWVCLRYNDFVARFSVQVHWLVRLFAFTTVAIYPSLRDYFYVLETDALYPLFK